MSDEPGFCPERWQTDDKQGPHWCAELSDHVMHRCCCGATFKPVPKRTKGRKR